MRAWLARYSSRRFSMSAPQPSQQLGPVRFRQRLATGGADRLGAPSPGSPRALLSGSVSGISAWLTPAQAAPTSAAPTLRPWVTASSSAWIGSMSSATERGLASSRAATGWLCRPGSRGLPLPRGLRHLAFPARIAASPGRRSAGDCGQLRLRLAPGRPTAPPPPIAVRRWRAAPSASAAPAWACRCASSCSISSSRPSSRWSPARPAAIRSLALLFVDLPARQAQDAAQHLLSLGRRLGGELVRVSLHQEGRVDEGLEIQPQQDLDLLLRLAMRMPDWSRQDCVAGSQACRTRAEAPCLPALRWRCTR